MAPNVGLLNVRDFWNVKFLPMEIEKDETVKTTNEDKFMWDMDIESSRHTRHQQTVWNVRTTPIYLV
jgi:hypothetical protein